MENEEYPEDWIDKLKYATAVCEAELDEESSIASLYVLDGIKDEQLLMRTPMKNDKINIEEELKYMNVYKSDDPNNYNIGKPGQVLIYDLKAIRNSINISKVWIESEYVK
jgi:hypothetical protein